METTAAAAATAAANRGFGHFTAQSDGVGQVLLVALALMSVTTWALMAVKGLTQYLRKQRSAIFLYLFWNARSLDAEQAEIGTRGAKDPFSHLSAQALHTQAHHARHDATRLSEAGLNEIGLISEPERP